MSDDLRLKSIVDLLRDRPFASVRDLQERLNVSASTVRRYIDKIDEQGEGRKVYGGISALQKAGYGAAFARRYDENRDLAVEAKRAIAEMAATLVEDGDTIAINAGSTCYNLGVKLADRSVRIFTNSMPLAAYLGEHGRCSLTVAGGDLHREPLVIYGPNASPSFLASKYFMGAQGIGPEGVLESHPLMVLTATEMSNSADQVILLADSRKFSIHARNVAVPLSRIATIITDDGITDSAARMIENAGVTLRVVSPGSAG